MIFALNNDERWDCPALRIHALNHYNPFPIPRLGQFRLALPIGAYNNHCGCDLAHHKAGLVKVVDIHIHDPILRNCIVNKAKLALNKLCIFT